MKDTLRQYEIAVNGCRDIFLNKTADYGTSWRVLRMISILDQIFIKAKRIRTIQELGAQRVGEDIHGESDGVERVGHHLRDHQPVVDDHECK